MKNEALTVGLAQIAPVWLNREETSKKIIDYIVTAGQKGCQLVVFGEALLPGYPFWIERTDGAKFDSPIQKELHAYYMKQAVCIGSGDLDMICKAARDTNTAVILGCIECPEDRGRHSLYCSLVYIDTQGTIQSVHRKLMPTYEERLSWSPGDGHGLQVHQLEAFTIGALNCWENWMPLARAALYGLGEDLHVAIWPGSKRNTADITRFIARESRSYVLSVSGVMTRKEINNQTPHYEHIIANSEEVIADGGSCIAAPDGEWLIAPRSDKEELIIATLDHKKVRQERQNFDPSGHYARPDVTQLIVNRKRQSIIKTIDEE